MNDANGTVYVVDDDPSVRRSLHALLKAHGFDADAFSSAKEFLDHFDGSMSGCLVVDVRMPGMSGLELQKQLAERRGGLSVIVISGHADIPTAVEAMRAGALDFIEKPFDEETLINAVRRALEVRRSGGDQQGLPADELETRLQRLTPREREVLDHLVLGEINKVIAHKLGISQRTVEIHRARIKEKMEAQSLADLIRMML
jgi:two-component system response regulator FixJ